MGGEGTALYLLDAGYSVISHVGGERSGDAGPACL